MSARTPGIRGKELFRMQKSLTVGRLLGYASCASLVFIVSPFMALDEMLGTKAVIFLLALCVLELTVFLSKKGLGYMSFSFAPALVAVGVMYHAAMAEDMKLAIIALLAILAFIIATLAGWAMSRDRLFPRKPSPPGAKRGYIG